MESIFKEIYKELYNSEIPAPKNFSEVKLGTFKPSREKLLKITAEVKNRIYEIESLEGNEISKLSALPTINQIVEKGKDKRLNTLLWKNLDRNNKEKYFAEADWALNSKGEVINQRAVLSEEDGRISPEEDFANNVEHLITNKNYKQKITPAIENCLRNILGLKNDK